MNLDSHVERGAEIQAVIAPSLTKHAHALIFLLLPASHHQYLRMMAYSDYGSAIDDDVETIHFGPPPRSENRDNLGYYNGPRDGHWSVSSSFGSAVDDRCPTVWQLGTDRTAKKFKNVKAISGGLLRKLARATVEDKRAAEAEVEDFQEYETDFKQKSSMKRSEPPTKPKGFYVPLLKDTPDMKDGYKDKRQNITRTNQTQPKADGKKKQVQRQQSRKKEARSPQRYPRADNTPPSINANVGCCKRGALIVRTFTDT